MYTPNFNDKRVRRKLKSALGMTLGCISDDKSRPLGTRFIDKHFGQAQLPLSGWLRKQLLVCTKESYNMHSGRCKEYTVNPQGVKLIQEILYDGYTPTPVEQPTYNHELAVEWAEENFDIHSEYEDKSQRLWHPIQYLKKDTRNSYLAKLGMEIQYDIRTAAPTLLHQRSWEYSYGHVLDTIDYYINNKDLVRKKLASETGLPEKNIKALLNSLFAGASLGASPRFSCWDMCNKDKGIIEYIKQHDFVVPLRADINQMWEYLKPELPVTQITTQTGKTRNMQMTPKNKWHLYFCLERQVLNAIRSYLDLHQLEYVLIHDAFVSKKLPLGVSDLKDYIEKETGFKLDFDQEVLSLLLYPSV